ncbi:MAG: UDP-N-acetylmuramate dehydrogenase [Micromonosporaceae bacterium]|nr:UDP-N-acetylmuramate dehydrogenase [Micromonosporaceae bacterium]
MGVPDVSADRRCQLAPLAGLTTLRLGGPARRLVTAASADEIVQSVRESTASGEPTLVLGGGSNVVIADPGFAGTAILLRSRGLRVVEQDATAVTIRVAAGEPWDEVVAGAVAAGWSGLECLSGIPGAAGATPIQNVGAYGQAVAQTITAVRVLDRVTGAVSWLPPEQCRFGYRTSVFKRSDRWVVLEVQFRLPRSPRSAPIRYAELAGALAVRMGDTAPLPVVREAVIALRAGKGMLLDPADPDTYSVGSFFTNPVLAPAAAATLVADGAAPPPPSWPEPGGLVKVSAAWLIEQAGFPKGYAGLGVAISSKHTLALTNRGTGTTAALLALAGEIRDGVRARFGVTLHAEPVLVDCIL